MKTTIGVYNSHDEAMQAVRELRRAGYPTQNLSVLGKVEGDADGDRDALENKDMKVAGAEVGAGAIAGTALGVLTGIGILAIPGFGFLFGAGALAGAIAGFDIGLIGGGVLSALTLTGVHGDKAKDYDKQLKEGKFLLIAQGDSEEVERAKSILQNYGTHSALDLH